MMRLFLLGLLFPAFTALAAEREVAMLNDPSGDDHGNGVLAYPQRADFERGDLDLVSLRLVRTDTAYRFEATFRNPIRNPASVPSDTGPEPMSYFARRGFYAFNIDIYIDQDRIKGSGNTYTMPGRQVRIDESHAWERAVILTPRPELMRQRLIDAVVETENAPNADTVVPRIDSAIFFPTDVQVRNRTVSFSVPLAFLAGGRPDTDWSITAFVTAAKTIIEADLEWFASAGTPLERLALGAMQPKPGRPRNTVGYSGRTAPPPVVDLLAPAPLKQQELLSGKTALAGVTWSASGAAAAPGTGTPVTSLARPTAPPPSAVPASSTPAPAPAPAAAPQGGIADRLRQLNELRAQGLITEQEYGELRRKILGEL